MHPDIGRIAGHEYRSVPNDTDVFLAAMRF
jgi:hypothetical protein